MSVAASVMDDYRSNRSAEGTPTQPASIMLIAAALLVVGVVMVASASVSLDRPFFSWSAPRTPWGRQAFFVMLGGCLMFLVRHVGVAAIGADAFREALIKVMYVATMLCLIAALIPGVGDPHRGSHRWLRFSVAGLDVGFQPSEVAKLSLIAFLAWLLGARGVDVRSLRQCFIPAATAVGVYVLLIGKENFGTAVLLSFIGGSMLLAAGCRIRHLLVLSLAGICALTILLCAAPYRLARLMAFFDVWADPHGRGYQPRQSLVTIASGGWFGRGLGAGVQKYGYLPESHSDFIFAVICEETGMAGAALILVLFATFVWFGIKVIRSSVSPFERLLAFGLTFTVGIQAVMNIAVVTVIAPTTGISLPFVSAGGSGILVFCVLAGLLAAVAERGRTAAGMDSGTWALAHRERSLVRTKSSAFLRLDVPPS